MISDRLPAHSSVLDRRAPSHLRRILVVAAVLLAITACQAVGTRPVIKIGLTAPFSGFDESVGYSVIGAVRQAIDERNQAGGVAGYSVELVALDDANQPQNAAQRAQEMIIDPAVMGVLGGFDGPAAAAAGAAHAGSGMPFVALSGDDTETAGEGQRSLRLTAQDSDAGRLAGEFAAQTLAARRVAIVSDQAAGQDALGDAFAAAVQAGGAAVVDRTQIERWQLDFAGAIRQVSAAAPDLIFFAGRAAEAGEFLKQARTAGVQATFLGGPGMDDPRLLQIAGPAAQGTYYVSTGLPLSQVRDEAQRANLTQASLRSPGPYTALAYDGASILLDALAQAITASGKPSRAAVAQALGATMHRGLTGDFAFDEQGNRLAAPLSIYRMTGDTYPGMLVQ